MNEHSNSFIRGKTVEVSKRTNTDIPLPRGRFPNWVQLSKLDVTPGCPIRTATAYKWVHCKRFPELFRRVGGKVFLDLDLLFKKAEAGELR